MEPDGREMYYCNLYFLEPRKCRFLETPMLQSWPNLIFKQRVLMHMVKAQLVYLKRKLRRKLGTASMTATLCSIMLFQIYGAKNVATSRSTYFSTFRNLSFCSFVLEMFAHRNDILRKTLVEEGQASKDCRLNFRVSRWVSIVLHIILRAVKSSVVYTENYTFAQNTNSFRFEGKIVLSSFKPVYCN